MDYELKKKIVDAYSETHTPVRVYRIHIHIWKRLNRYFFLCLFDNNNGVLNTLQIVIID